MFPASQAPGPTSTTSHTSGGQAHGRRPQLSRFVRAGFARLRRAKRRRRARRGRESILAFSNNIMKKPAIFIALVMGLACANGPAQTSINGTYLQNTRVGFNGFSAKLPDTYEYAADAGRPSVVGMSFGQVAYKIASHLDSRAGYTTLETMAFTSAGKGMAVSVTRILGVIPSLKEEQSYKTFVEKFLRSAAKRERKEFVREIRMIGANQVICTGSEPEDGLIVIFYTVAVPPGTLLTFVGCGKSEAKNFLIKDMDETLASLNIGKAQPKQAPGPVAPPPRQP